MNRILTCGLAAMVATLVVQPVYADKDHGDGGRGGGGGGRGGGGRAAAPARVAPAPAVHSNATVMRSQPAPRMSGPVASTRSARTFSQPAPRVSGPVASTRSDRTFTPSVTRGRTFGQPGRTSPSVAFGGSTVTRSGRNFATTDPSVGTTFRGSNIRGFRPPTEMSREWDRGRVHEWNHHRYRFSGGDWVIIDGGYPYDNYGYVDEAVPETTLSYDYASDSLAMSVQDRLDRLGYSAGPVDGVIGPQTRDAIADFQEDHGLPVTGGIDRPLLRALGLR